MTRLHEIKGGCYWNTDIFSLTSAGGQLFTICPSSKRGGVASLFFTACFCPLADNERCFEPMLTNLLIFSRKNIASPWIFIKTSQFPPFSAYIPFFLLIFHKSNFFLLSKSLKSVSVFF